ncbi:3969_t:CDS:2 [Racocetra persica]|uniref:3969_t:CDS:1 n=1 Tax=Racocetra persica TaxID=160502 RepID=A0ACA9LWZ2_9GLOM|nr:3969_t:CDS:2 [Racocetra persica]
MFEATTVVMTQKPSLVQRQYLHTICNEKCYKTSQGLICHENLAHHSYNQPPADIISLPLQHQLIKFPYTVAEFGSQLSRFSPAKRAYWCVFKGYEAESMLEILLGDKQWGTQYYKKNQKSYVQLYL